MSDDYSEEASELKKKQKLRRDQELDDIRVLLKSLPGQRFFVRLLREGKVFSTTFSPDSSSSAFLEGHRNLALKFFNDITIASPEIVPMLLTEGQDIAG